MSRLKRMFYPAADAAEAWLRRRHEPGDEPIFVILGPPRSGTTLAYLSFASRFRCSYFCNTVDQKAEWPCLATLLQRSRIRGFQSVYSNQYGRVPGPSAPAEARRLWSTWFGWNYAAEAQDDERGRQCRTVVSFVGACVGEPFVTKNPDHALRIPALRKAFPRSLFIRVRRPRLETARSLLNARQKYLGSFDNWFGTRTLTEAEAQRLSAVGQVLQQVDYMEDIISRDLGELVPAGQQMTLDYAALCGNPTAALAAVAELAERNGIMLSSRAALPERFDYSTGKPLPEDLEAELAAS